MQKNYDNRQGHCVFKSKTGRHAFGQQKSNQQVPPMGIYEPKFATGTEEIEVAKKVELPKTKREETLPKAGASDDHQVAMKYIHKSYEHKPKVQQFSCFAGTRKVNFSLGTQRDEVSFLKKLARIQKARELFGNA